MKGIGYFQNLRIFLESFWIFLGIFLEFFGRIFLEEFFRRNFLGGFFWEDFLGGILWEDFLGRNYLVEINKELMFLSRFLGNFVSMEGRRRKKEGGF